MATKRITVPCSSAGFERAAKWLEDYKKDLNRKANEIVGKMLKEGEVTAKILLTHFDTGETSSSIMGYREGNHGMLTVGGNAIWIEFGTGVYAEGQVDYPKEVDGIVGHGQYGEGHGADPRGWYYYDEVLEKVQHTYGIPANMFMYNTAQMLRREYARMAKEIFK